MADDLLAQLGERVRTLRDLHGLRQEDLARVAGLRRSSIANLEAGRQNTPVTTLAVIAAELRTSVGVLLGDSITRPGDGLRPGGGAYEVTNGCGQRRTLPVAQLVVSVSALDLAANLNEYYPPYMGLLVGDRPEDEECARLAGLDFTPAAEWRALAHSMEKWAGWPPKREEPQ